MKNYKKLVLIAMIFLFIISIYKLLSDAKALENKYVTYISDARKKQEDGILNEAIVLYTKALDMKKSISLCSEIGEAFLKKGEKREAVNWGNYMIDSYPTNSEGYEYLIKIFYEEKNYESCFEIYDQAKKRNAISKGIQKIRDSIEYQYELSYEAYSEVGTFGGGYCAVRLEDSWGYIDEKGEKAIPFVFKEAGVFASTYAPVKTKEGELYFIDKEGNKAVALPKEIKAESIGFLENDVYILFDGKEYAYYNSEGKQTIKDTFELASTFNQGRAFVKKNGGWYLIDETGTKIGKKEFADIVMDSKGITFRNERAFIKEADEYIMIDLEGNQIGNTRFQEVKPFADNTLAAVKQDGRWGFVNKEGRIVIKPNFEEAESFSNGLAAIRADDLWGYITEEGKIAIEPAFQYAGFMQKSGGALIRKNDEWIFLELIRTNY